MRPHPLKHFLQIACLTLCITTLPALAQEEPLCSLDQISEALNNLECRADGSFVSVESVTKTITVACDTTTTTDLCHACFRKGRGKAALAVKSLIKLRMLPRTALRNLRDELELSEDETCSWKEDDSIEWSSDDDNSELNDRPDRGRGRGRGRGGFRWR